MLVIRRIVTVAVMVYLLLALLFVITGGARDAMMALSGNQNPADFWYVMTLIGAGLMLLLLLTENVHAIGIRRDVTRHEQKVNELKAKLYDHQLEQRSTDVRPATTVPRPEPAPGAIARGSMTPPPATPYSGDDHPTDTRPSDRPVL